MTLILTYMSVGLAIKETFEFDGIDEIAIMSEKNAIRAVHEERLTFRIC